MYESLIRPLLFRLTPDQSHELARLALRWPALWRFLGRPARVHDPRLAASLAGLPLANPIGLGPGFDKNAELLPALAQLGFGYVVVGSITREPRAGNPFPRLARYPDRLSLANSMGLPNRGLAAAVRALHRFQRTGCPIVASVAGFGSDDLLEAAVAVEPYVDAVEIGLVCPNTTETERLEEARIFTALAEGLASRLRKPVFVKLPPHHTEPDRERTFQMLDVCLRVGIEGVSVSGSRTVVEPRLGSGRGSLSGQETFADALRIVRDVHAHTRGGLAIKAAGGVFTGQDAAEMLQAGASSVEVYTSFIYRGWDVAGRINRELLALLEQRGLDSVDALRPAAPADTSRGVFRLSAGPPARSSHRSS